MPSSPPTPTPEQLACDAQAGATQSFVRLVELFEARVFSFILRRVGRRNDAEDLTQDTFLRAFEKLGRYSTRWRFSTWLFTIASRLSTDHLRRMARDRRIQSGQAAEPARNGDPGATIDDRERGSRLWSMAAESLSTESHAALWLRYREDLPIRDIAHILGKSQVATRVMLMRARDTLASSAGPGEFQPFDSRRIHTAVPERMPSPELAGGAVR